MAVLQVAFVALAAAPAEAPSFSQQLAPVWSGVRDIAVDCRGGADVSCARIIDLVADNAPYPVIALTNQTLPTTLVIHAIFGSERGRTTLTLSAERAVAFDDAQGTLLPRSFMEREKESDDALVTRALDRFLPWRRPHRQGRTIALPTGRLS